jgi:methyl-accepting chemotaxis protein
MSPFSFFKKKDKENDENVKGIFNKLKLSTRSSTNNPGNALRIDDALNKLKDKEREITASYLEKLKRPCGEIKESYETISNIAKNIELEEIEIEESKLTPLINNTKKTILRTLKREAANPLPIPRSLEEISKFKESTTASINRFGEVTSSHSRVINTFLKKHANDLRNELKKITENSSKVNGIYNELSKDLETVENCKNNLNGILVRQNEINILTNTIDGIKENIKKVHEENISKEKEIKKLQDLPSYGKTVEHQEMIETLKKDKEKTIENIKEISTHLSKAAHKYSYGSTKGTKEKIDNLIKDPTKISEEIDISPYLEFLHNLKKAVNDNSIVLKDSNRVIQYCDQMIQILPDFKNKVKDIDLKISNLHNDKNKSILEQIKTLKTKIDENNKTIQSENSRKEDIANQINEEKSRINILTKNAEEQLNGICKNDYTIITSYN